MRLYHGRPVIPRPDIRNFSNAARRVVTNQRCIFCLQFHIHRVLVYRAVRGPQVAYSRCPETAKTLVVQIPDIN